MKNLNDFGVVELKKEELGEVEGGFWPVLLAGVIIGAAVEIMGDWEHFKQGLKDAIN